jgi:hypothetical protein
VRRSGDGKIVARDGVSCFGSRSNHVKIEIEFFPDGTKRGYLCSRIFAT